ncbi:hypothetical protein A8709_25855 [Paenibacillus pectinilyticus]|uniref:Uncharacterized protein n=1 Tax=Paenibacillus pectinilyticus TaxID=512399 RepID=A0A1C1A153_9BACL|nr:hypothetical protein [Paenibacillus pectinilyticus]OCT14257.1 hypothetical protein A8709_25855 [Paenibacillus pectinilyticus]
MSSSKMKYKLHDRISHNVNSEYDIVFDRCTPIINGVTQNEEEILMRYTKNGRTVNNAPAFSEIDMAKTIVKLYNSTLLSAEAKDILKKGIINRLT